MCRMHSLFPPRICYCVLRRYLVIGYAFDEEIANSMLLRLVFFCVYASIRHINNHRTCLDSIVWDTQILIARFRQISGRFIAWFPLHFQAVEASSIVHRPISVLQRPFADLRPLRRN